MRKVENRPGWHVLFKITVKIIIVETNDNKRINLSYATLLYILHRTLSITVVCCLGAFVKRRPYILVWISDTEVGIHISSCHVVSFFFHLCASQAQLGRSHVHLSESATDILWSAALNLMDICQDNSFMDLAIRKDMECKVYFNIIRGELHDTQQQWWYQIA